MLPLHHGDPSGEERNWLQRLNDSDGATFAANTLHSVGALLFAAGIALYLYIAHVIRRSRGASEAPNLGLLNYAHGFTLVGIALNGVGGLMRLYQSDHPSLDRLGDSTWVQVLLVKHLFLVAGVGLAVWLTWRTHRLSDPETPRPAIERASPRMVAMALGSFLTILLAAVLGAVAANVDLNEDLGIVPAAMTDGSGAGEHADHPGFVAQSQTQGKITGTAIQPGAQAQSFLVPEGADRLMVTLEWTLQQARLGLRLLDPDGREAQGDMTTKPTNVVATVPARAGRWTVEVRAEQAVEEPYRLEMVAARSGGARTVLERTVDVRGGGWFEVNLNIERGQTFSYAWNVVASDATTYFDIHIHPSATQVLYPVRGEWNRLEGNYTHAHSSDAASLLWENNATAPLKLQYRVWGDFLLDSYAQSRV